MKTIDLDGVQPGDILFTARPGKLERSIRFATRGEVSHAIICVQNGSFVDSTTAGVQASNLQRELFDDEERVYQFRLKEPASRETIAMIVDYARSEIGARYSIPEAIRSVASIRKPRTTRQFCSRLIARVYAKAGIQLVPDTDYCSPEDLRRSPLLVEIPIVMRHISDQEIAWRSSVANPVEATQVAQNTILAKARDIDSSVETMEDIVGLLIRDVTADDTISKVLADSGYLTLWQVETTNYPWRYQPGLIDTMLQPQDMESLMHYCIGTIREAYSGGIRFSIMLQQYRALQTTYPRRAFQLEMDLYEILVRNDQARREIAYNWLERHFPDDLRQEIEQIEPHDEYWFSIMERVEPRLGAHARTFMDSTGSSTACSICGDMPSGRFRLANGAETMTGVPSLRLCDDCLDIRRTGGEDWLPFLR